MEIHSQFYRYPEYYDAAFGYRDVAAEVDFLVQCFRHWRRNEPAAVYEVACGVGYHALELARRGYPTGALDLQPEMVAYLRQKAQAAGIDIALQVADMRDFTLPQPVDLAVNMLTSFQYLLTNEDIVAHLQATRRALTPDGLYIIELNHPREYFGGQLLQPTRWKVAMAAEGRPAPVEIEVVWGGQGVCLDPVREVVDIEAAYHVHDGAEVKHLEQHGSLRMLLPGELRALVALAGGFRVEAMYGDFDLAQPLDASDKSWRMLVVLGKQG